MSCSFITIYKGMIHDDRKSEDSCFIDHSRVKIVTIKCHLRLSDR